MSATIDVFNPQNPRRAAIRSVGIASVPAARRRPDFGSPAKELPPQRTSGRSNGGGLAIGLGDCRVRTTLDLIRGKWKPMIIEALKGSMLCYGKLRRILPEPRKKVLTAQLRELERDGIVARRVRIERVIRVEYWLTNYGWTLIPVLTSMSAWGQKHKHIALTRLGNLQLSSDGPNSVTFAALAGAR